MTALVVLVPIVLPLGLLGWFVLFPAGSALGWLVQAIGMAAMLFVLARIAQWALPVWWLPWVYAAFWVIISAWGLLGLPAKTVFTRSWVRLGEFGDLSRFSGRWWMVWCASAQCARVAPGRDHRHCQPLRAGALPCGPRRVQPAG